jgi:hypothetical protein
MQRAMNDGADIISVSLLGDASPDEYYALARAITQGVPVVQGAGNDSDGFIPFSAGMSGQVTVGASDLKGDRADYSNYGDEMELLAPGHPITMRVVDSKGKLSKVTKGHSGTSFAAPMVSGALALAMQRWPDADGNQLVRSLLDTTSASFEEHFPKMVEFAVLDAVGFVHNDPSGYESSSPLIFERETVPGSGDVYKAAPDQEMISEYVNGLARPDFVAEDASYVYRGTNEDYLANLPAGMRAEPGTSPGGVSVSESAEVSGSPDVSAEASPAVVDDGAGGGFWLVGGLVGVVVVVAVVVVVFVLLRRKPASVGAHGGGEAS